MDAIYTQVKEQGQLFYHKNYRSFHHGYTTAFDSGNIQLISLDINDASKSALVSICFKGGNISQWSSRWFSSYIFQFGVAVSHDGQYIFAQTWKNGLFCLDSNTGELIWKTKSKRGITNIFVNDTTVLCHQHEHALQLIDIKTGEVLQEKRTATAWGFTAIDHRHIVCQVTAKRWEIIDTANLHTVATFSHREFTNRHEDFCVNHIEIQDSQLIIKGFKNQWDLSSNPPSRLPNLEFTHSLMLKLPKD